MKNIKKISEQGNERRSMKLFLASSAHVIVICVILLGSVSWAWFTQTIDTPDIKVQAAEYGIRAEVSSNGIIVTSGDCCSVTDGDGLVLEVEKGKVHDITLTALGSAELYGGYCVVSAGDDLHYTMPIGGKDNLQVISFQVFFKGSGIGKIEFLPYWGIYPNTIPGENIIPLKEDILKQGYGYIVSGGDIAEVTPGNAKENQDEEMEEKE